MGLDNGLLWQVTKALALFDDRIEVQCARDFSVAKEISSTYSFHIIVVDGWEQSWEAGYSLGWDEVSGLGPGKWVIMVDSIPMEGLLDDRVSSAAVFLEKPFNPKEFPLFLLRLLEEEDEQDRGSEREEGKLPEPSISADESYSFPEAQDTESEKTKDGSIPSQEASSKEIEPPSGPDSPAEAETGGEDFFAYMDNGFACLKNKDWAGARTHWEKALEFRPQDKRLLSNLHRLKGLMGKESDQG